MPVEIRSLPRPFEGASVLHVHPGDTLVLADLSGLALDYADLRGANLSGATMRGTNLGCADLTGANLRDVRMNGVGAHKAVFTDADMTGARLTGAYCRRACFTRTVMREVSATGACFREAHMQEADMRSIDASFADLRDAVLTDAVLAHTSHDMLAEVLRRDAGDDVEKLKVAGYVLVRRDFCWEDFLKSDDPLVPWAVSVAARALKSWDRMPEALVQYVAAMGLDEPPAES